jgi:signal transduction histidine kinase
MKEATYALACIAIILAGIGAYAYINATTNTRAYAELVSRAQTIAALIDPDRVANLSVSATDLVNADYLHIKGQITAARSANPDLRFIYLMAERDGRVYFMVDSEDPASEDYSPPGQEYDEASPELLAGWEAGAPPVLEIYEDRWGNWISALAPIRTETGETIALVGLDQNADAHRTVFLSQVGLVVLATVALLSLVTFAYILSRREQDLIDMKADFVAIASHELRTPLMALRWELARLKDDTSLAGGTRTSLHTMYDQVCTLIDLSTSFLMTTSADHGLMHERTFKDFDLASLLRARIAAATPGAAARSITLTHNLTPDIHAMVRGDEDRLRLVVDNLITNAVKYSRPNSEITISFRDQGTSKEFSVRDSGIGIPEKELASVFSGFRRATNAARSGVAGTGFGLYIAKRIIDFHGGTITCLSKEGAGSTFTVSLPGV